MGQEVVISAFYLKQSGFDLTPVCFQSASVVGRRNSNITTFRGRSRYTNLPGCYQLETDSGKFTFDYNKIDKQYKMTQNIPDILLWLFIINLGIAFGAGLYETRIILPQWFIKLPGTEFQVNSKAMNETDTGRKFWAMVTTMPLTLLTIANLVVALQSNGQRHDWWLAASLIILAERIGTFAFFIPTAIKLMRAGTLSQSKVTSMVSIWLRLNYVRNALTLLGWLLALRALSVMA